MKKTGNLTMKQVYHRSCGIYWYVHWIRHALRTGMDPSVLDGSLTKALVKVKNVRDLAKSAALAENPEAFKRKPRSDKGKPKTRVNPITGRKY